MEQNKNLEKLRDELEKAKTEKAQAEHQLKRTENRLQYREKFSRKERTHHLIVLGAIMEQYFPELKGLSEVQLGKIIRKLDYEEFHKVFADAIESSGEEVNA